MSVPMMLASPFGALIGSRAGPPQMNVESAAKAAWLAKLEAPQWGPAATAAAPAPAVDPDATRDVSEDAAKAAWLAKLDAPQWGPAADAGYVVPTVAAAAVSEDAAKAAWLAKLEAPTWAGAKAYPNLPASVKPGVLTGQAMLDLLDDAKARGCVLPTQLNMPENYARQLRTTTRESIHFSTVHMPMSAPPAFKHRSRALPLAVLAATPSPPSTASPPQVSTPASRRQPRRRAL